MENEKIECKWLNKNYGDGYWICDGFLKATNKEICKDCPERKKQKSLQKCDKTYKKSLEKCERRK